MRRFWPGDNAAEGTLKRIITEDTLAVEPKFIDLELRRNRLHIAIASNNEWVVPASFDERRFGVSNVSDKYARNKASEEDRKKYFVPLYQEIESGGAAAMLYDLLQMDLKGWHPRYDVPQTAALQDQKLLSLSYADQWWYELLQTATLQRPDAYNPRRAQSSGLYKAARKRNPGLRFSSDHILGKILENNGCKHCRVRGLRGWEFPELKEAREKWDEKLPGTQWDEATEWVKDEDDDDGPF